MCATYDAIVRRLDEKGFIRRYDRDDGFASREGAFVICSFWAVEYLARRGDTQEARERMGHILSFANDVGLFAEEIDPETGAFLGNFPQAFSHTGLISAALAIHEAETGAEHKGKA
jgi:GH15 family glucan-1,4-alpha-glucosidase